ncbi:MAG: OmpA family protein [Pseudomonadota bacterium]
MARSIRNSATAFTVSFALLMPHAPMAQGVEGRITNEMLRNICEAQPERCPNGIKGLREELRAERRAKREAAKAAAEQEARREARREERRKAREAAEAAAAEAAAAEEARKAARREERRKAREAEAQEAAREAARREERRKAREAAETEAAAAERRAERRKEREAAAAAAAEEARRAARRDAREAEAARAAATDDRAATRAARNARGAAALEQAQKDVRVAERALARARSNGATDAELRRLRRAAREANAEVERLQQNAVQRAARQAERAERRRQRESAAALAAESADEGTIESEKITTANSRSSREERASRRDNGNDLLKILGAAAAGFAVGKLLDNGDRVVQQQDDRVVVQRDGQLVVLKDENALLRQPGNQFRTQTFTDGSTRQVVLKPDGSQVVTVRASDGSILRRSRIRPDGLEIVLIDETTARAEPIEISELPPQRITREVDYSRDTDRAALRRALRDADLSAGFSGYSLRQIRTLREVRELVPPIELTNITFDTGSAVIRVEQAATLSALGNELAALIAEDPDEIFLIEGHTDSVGSEITNLTLSDRRAESVALALAEYYGVPPENLIVQGYGEQHLKIPAQGDIRQNRRATVRRITPLLRTVALQ